jgi:hypothetical protein
MPAASFTTVFSSAVALAGLLVACERGPTSPTPPSIPPPTPPINPTGYRVSGQVSSDTGLGVPGARVEVTEGRATGLVQETNDSGRYEFSGIWGGTQFRVSRNGYQPQSTDTWVDRDSALDFRLSPGEDFSGTYALTITASDDCRAGEGQLPDEARVRRYTAVMTQNRSELQVVLTGEAFPIVGGIANDRFRGKVEAERVVFSMSWPEDDWPDVLEQLSTSTFFVVQGTVVATGPADRLAGMLDGAIQVSEGDTVYPFRRHIAWCSSSKHQFVLSR